MKLGHRDNLSNSVNNQALYWEKLNATLPVSVIRPAKFENQKSAPSDSDSSANVHGAQSEAIMYNLIASQPKSKVGHANQTQFATNVVNNTTRYQRQSVLDSSNELDKLYSRQMKDVNRPAQLRTLHQLNSSNEISASAKLHSTMVLSRKIYYTPTTRMRAQKEKKKATKCQGQRKFRCNRTSSDRTKKGAKWKNYFCEMSVRSKIKERGVTITTRGTCRRW